MKKRKLAIVDVRVNEPSKVPPRYYLDPTVQEALRLTIRTDVIVNGKKCPIGTAPVYGLSAGSGPAAAVRFRIARSDFFRQIMRELPGLIVVYVALIFTALIFLLVREL